MLTVTDLSISFPPDRTILDRISFHVDPGESIALIGANGAGKTSLLLALVGITPYQGSIQFEDIALTPKTAPKIRQKIGFVFQNPDDQLFCQTLRDDIAFGLENMGLPKDEINRRIDEWLDRFELTRFANQPSQTLSGGEKRIAALATVLAMTPSCLILDEPTSFLDARARKRLENALTQSNCARIIATHNIPFAARMCSRAILINDHKIIADGPALDLFHNADLMESCGADYIS